MTTDDELARIAYETQTEGMNVPPWYVLPDHRKERWRRAAHAVATRDRVNALKHRMAVAAKVRRDSAA